MEASHIFDLPQEILSSVLSYLNPGDLVRFGRTSHQAQAFISPDNQLLWQSTFLHIFDDPHEAWIILPESARPKADAVWDWHAELQRRLKALQAIQQANVQTTDDERASEHLSALLSIIDTAKFSPSRSEISRGKRPQMDDRSSLNIQMLGPMHEFHPGLENLIHNHTIQYHSPRSDMERYEWHSPGRPRTRSMAVVEMENKRPEAASRLHVLHGLTIRERRDRKAIGFARRRVYNWNLTGEDTDYGPFIRDGSGRVNWNVLEGLCSVITRNFEMCVDGHIALPQGFCYSIPHRTLIDPTIPDDWARVTGTWLGTYAFLDYADLFAFNMWNQANTQPSLDDEPEACGEIARMELRLDDSIRDDPRLKTKLPICYDLPPLYFSGGSRSDAGNTRTLIEVRGCASLVPGGREVRWRYIISYGGSDQWQLEGVQPGGIRSGGIYGVWSQADHENNSPIGPFCYFPLELCKPTSIVLVG